MRMVLFLCFCFILAYAEKLPKSVQSASELDYPPYCIVKEGKADGFSVELLRSALKAMNVEVNFYVDAWSVVKKDLEIGKIDVLPLVGRTPEREAVFDFSVPYLVMHGAIIVRKGTAVHHFKDLENKEVMVMKDDNAHEFLMRQSIPLRIVPMLSYEEALKELARGKHDAVVVQKLVGSQLIQSLGLHTLSIVPHTIEGFRQDFSFAVTEGNKELLAILNEGLSIIMTNGEYQALYQKWLAPIEFEAQQREKAIYLLGGIVILLLLIVMVIAFWQRSLRRQVLLKTKALLISEEKLKQLNASLETRIQEAISQMHEKDKLMISQSRQAAMGEMIAMIAHQWRQPISVISMIVNNISLDIDLDNEISKEALSHALKEISEQTKHVSQTIDDFRNFFKPNKEKQTLFLKEIVEGALHIIGPSLYNHTIDVKIENQGEYLVEVYRNELIQVVINLLNNAKDSILAHKSHPSIIIIKLYKQSDINTCCIDIEDNGGGIPEDIIFKLGEPYVSTKSSNGTGLGVYMSKIIIEKHFNGTLTWKNSEIGAIFKITLPLLTI